MSETWAEGNEVRTGDFLQPDKDDKIYSTNVLHQSKCKVLGYLKFVVSDPPVESALCRCDSLTPI